MRPPKLATLASGLMNNTRWQWLAVLFWASFLFVLSLMPSRNIPRISLLDNIMGVDKWVHALVYGVFAVLLCLPLRKWRIFGGLIAVSLSSAFGAAMEWLQYVSNTGRHYDLADMLANTFGAVVGYLIFRYWPGNRKRNE